MSEHLRQIIPLVSVTRDRWRAGIKFLMGLGTNPELTPRDQRIMRAMLRGEHTSGMGEADAQRTLRYMGWRV